MKIVSLVHTENDDECWKNIFSLHFLSVPCCSWIWTRDHIINSLVLNCADSAYRSRDNSYTLMYIYIVFTFLMIFHR